MPYSSSANEIIANDDGIFAILNEGQKYVIVDSIPENSLNKAVDATGKILPLTITYGSGKYLLRADTAGAVFPVKFELQSVRDVFYTCVV